MAESVLKGEEAEVNDTESYDNGIKVVPAYLLPPVSVDASNVEKEVVETGYYSKEEIGLK